MSDARITPNFPSAVKFLKIMLRRDVGSPLCTLLWCQMPTDGARAAGVISSHPTECIHRRHAYTDMYNLDFRSGSHLALAIRSHILSTSKHLFSWFPSFLQFQEYIVRTWDCAAEPKNLYKSYTGTRTASGWQWRQDGLLQWWWWCCACVICLFKLGLEVQDFHLRLKAWQLQLMMTNFDCDIQTSPTTCSSTRAAQTSCWTVCFSWLFHLCFLRGQRDF